MWGKPPASIDHPLPSSAGRRRQMERTEIAAALSLLVSLILTACAAEPTLTKLKSTPPPDGSLCSRLLHPMGYPCTEHTVQTNDGYLLTVHRIPHGKNGLKGPPGPPVFLQHGLFAGGDSWFVNSPEESLGFILADHGFDVWVGNVRGTYWSQRHIALSVHNREFWDWSWQELALIDLPDMISYVYSETKSKVFYIGHSQGSIMALAAFTMPDTVKMIRAAALLCPISYLDHLSSRFVLRAVKLHLDQLLLNMGIHQLNFRSTIGIELLEYLCDGHMDCNSMLSTITGENCCLNKSRLEYYMEYEPHPSSTKNLNHLFQMIRKGTFAKYDYGLWGNMKRYGQPHPPAFDLQDVPESLPLWMTYGGEDAIADVADVKRTIKELRSEPETVYLDPYGHIDFIMSVNAGGDVYGSLMKFFKSYVGHNSY